MGKSREKEGDEPRRAGEGEAERPDQKGATKGKDKWEEQRGGSASKVVEVI